MMTLIQDYGADLLRAIGLHTIYAVSYTHLAMRRFTSADSASSAFSWRRREWMLSLIHI